MSEGNIEGMRLHFIKFETKYIEGCMDFIREKMQEANHDETVKSINVPVAKVIKATGGGAHKYSDLIRDKLNLT